MIVDAISMIEFITSLNLLRIGIDTFQCVMIQDIMLLCLIIFCLAHHGTLWNNDRHTATPPHRHVYTYPMSVEMKKVKIIYHCNSRYKMLIINNINNIIIGKNKKDGLLRLVLFFFVCFAYLMKSSSRYFGSVQRPSSTIISRWSIS